MNFKSYLAENRKDYMSLLEGTMSDIHQLANDSKDIESFTKDFFKQFGAKIKKTSDSEEWVKSLYSEMAESVVTEAKFVKEFDKAVLDATTKEEVLEVYPNAEFFIGKLTHFFGELDKNLFFRAHYAGKKDGSFKIKSVYSKKGSNYVHLFNELGESAVTEAKDDYMARYKDTNINLKKAYKHLNDEQLNQLYLEIGELISDKKLKVKDVTLFFESVVNEDKVDVASLSIGNTYKDKKGYTVKVIDIKGTGNIWKVTYQYEDGKKETVSTSLDKGINLYESVVNEAKIKVTKKEWPYVEFKDGGKKHKVEFDYEDIIDDHGNEGQDQYWLGKDDDGQEWMIDVYASSNGDVEEVHYDTIVKESAITEGRKVTLKRQYTENHPELTAGKSARVRNKMLEAIGDGNITQEEFDSILKELSSNGKRWSKNNARYFNVSEEGISLTRFGSKILSSITINEEEPTNTKPLEMKVNEETIDNPKIWVPGEFDKAISKLPNSQITREVVLKVAKKFKINPNDAISYVEYGWALDLQENKNTNMKTQFIYESFSSFVESINESEAENILDDLLDERGGDMEELYGMDMKDALDTVEAYGHKGSKAKKIAQELYSLCNESVDAELNEAFKSSKLRNLLTMSAAGRHGETKDLAKRFYQYTKIQLDQVGDEHILDMDMNDAFKASKDNDRVVFFVSDSEKKSPYAKDGVYQIGTGLVAISRGKDFLGSSYIRSYDRSKPSTVTLSKDGSAVGTNKEYKGWGASGLSSVKRIIEVSDRAYSISISALQTLLGSVAKRNDREAAQSGAVALQSDKEFKDQNRKRYETILANKASNLPLDKLVSDAIDTISEQIKSGLSKGAKGKYGDIIIGLNKKGREVKVKDASNHMSNILDDYSRYCSYVREEEETITKYGKSESWYAKSVKEYAKRTSDKLKQIEDMSYAW